MKQTKLTINVSERHHVVQKPTLQGSTVFDVLYKPHTKPKNGFSTLTKHGVGVHIVSRVVHIIHCTRILGNASPDAKGRRAKDTSEQNITHHYIKAISKLSPTLHVEPIPTQRAHLPKQEPGGKGKETISTLHPI